MIKFLLLTLFLLIGSARAQIQIGTIKGAVIDQVGSAVSGAGVRLNSSLTGERIETATDSSGSFVFNNVPFNRYLLRVEARGFVAQGQAVQVRSNLPLELTISLRVAGTSEQIEVVSQENLVDPASASSATTISAGLIKRAPRANRSRQLQELVATAPGMATENNGLLHVRGVEDGILYVLDGIPVVDRLDALSASSFDVDTIEAMQVIAGNIPAEFGGRNGAVVVLQPKSGTGQKTAGSLRAGAGDFRTGELAATLASSPGKDFGLLATLAAYRSNRFLDSVDPRNFNNRGGAVNLNLRADYHPTGGDTLLVNLSGNGTDFQVTNDLLQQQRGQRQRQELRDYSLSASWQHLFSGRTAGNFALYHRRHGSQLFGSEQDIPIFAAQDRAHTRTGLIASLTQERRGHMIKAGLEASRVAAREFFTFFITDEEEAAEREVSEAALEFDRDDPFIFRDRRARWQFSFYLQDQFSPLPFLTVQAGLRYDRSNLLVSEDQLSPRLGAVYFISPTKTALRASYNRLFQPPQIDNLLLSSSEQARRLSPFAGGNVAGENRGGADIRSERVTAWEAGVAQDVRGWARIDAVYWRRNFRNVGDPNVFFNTTIIFPNSVSSGFSRGLDLRLDVAERRGFSGWLSYTNMRILQTGPINGGLFLTDEFIEIGPGTRFIPDQDQRNTGAFGLTWQHERRGLWLTLGGRHESGVPLEVEEERLDELKSAPGAELVDFERGRVKPRTIFNLAGGVRLCRRDRVVCRAQLEVLNLGGRLFAYNFGNPFEGTHFGYGRRWNGGLSIELR